MERHINWPRRLNETVNGEVKAHLLGHKDNLMLCRKAARAVTGQWPPKERAGTIYDTLCQWFGEPVPAAMGRRGDIAYVDGYGGVIVGARAVLILEQGVSFVPITKLDKAFRVG